MLKKSLIVVAAIVLAFLVFVATRPATYQVERSLAMAARPAVLFPYLNAPKEFVAWSPWQKLDPNMKTTYAGPVAGVGASYAWVGNSAAGSGKMTITHSKANELVQQDLEFVEPFASKSTVSFTVVPAADGSKVTWAMNGDNDFAGKLLCVFVSMDGMIGKDIEEGLGKLKVLVEAKAALPVGDAPPAPAGPVDGGTPAGH